MLNHNVYIVWTYSTEDNKKHYSTAEKVSAGNNLLDYKAKRTFIDPHNFAVLSCMNVCKTWKEAKQLSHFWNECYRNNGTYMFDR